MARAKGTPNRVSAHVKDGLVRAFEDLGGQEGLVAWAKEDPENRKLLYSWWARMAPKEIGLKGDVTADVKVAWDK